MHLNWNIETGITNHVVYSQVTGRFVWMLQLVVKNGLLLITALKSHAYQYVNTHTTSVLPIHYYLGGRATLGLIVSCSYCAAHLWRSHYKIHKLFSHVPALFTLSSLQLVQHNCLKSPSPLCSIDRIKQLLLIRKKHRAPKERRRETKRNCKLLDGVFDLAVSRQ